MSGKGHMIAIYKKSERGMECEFAVHSTLVRSFVEEIIDNCFDAKVECDPNFALGFAAAIDAFASGRIDFLDALATVNEAWRDVNDVTGRPCRVTDCMRVYCDGGAVS